MLVLVGHPTLRHPEGEEQLAPGDVVCFPPGPEGAHQLRNDGDEPVRLIIVSTKISPDYAVYPDSGKVGIYGDHVDDLFRLSSAVDYYDGEA